MPLAKYVALHGGELSFPFRRYQIGKVYRGERAQRGRFREFYQADIDVIGLLDFLYLRSDALMHPVLARVEAGALTRLRPNPDEVADTFLLPLDWLTAHPPTLYRYALRPMIGQDFPYGTVQIPPDYSWGDGRMEVPVYNSQPYPLWGLTARITYYLLKNVQA